MGVRVRIEVKYRGKNVGVTALVSMGFEGDVPEILIPIQIAERLEIWPDLPDETIIETYRSASGLMKVYRVKGAKIYLIAEGLESNGISAYLVISEYTDEVLINDQLISSLGIVIEDPAKGLWRLKGEKEIRKSESYY